MFEFLQFIADWFNSTIYTFVVDAMAYVYSTFFILWVKAKLFGLTFAWDIAKGVISNLGINTAMQNAWGAIPAETLSSLRFFRVPDAVNLMITAGVARLVLSFLPF